MAAPAASTKHLILDTTVNGSVTSAVSSSVDISRMMLASFQTVSDGGAAITVDIQGSNIGTREQGWATPRDDTAASVDWITLVTNTIASGAAASRMDDLMLMAHRVLRVKITRTSGSGNVKVIFFTQGWG